MRNAMVIGVILLLGASTLAIAQTPSDSAWTDQCVRRQRAAGNGLNVAVEQCVGQLFTRDMTAKSYRYMDLVNTLVAERVRLAERADNGQITEAEMKRLMAEAATRLSSEEHARDAQSDSANAARRGANAAQDQADTARLLLLYGNTVTVAPCAGCR